MDLKHSSKTTHTVNMKGLSRDEMFQYRYYGVWKFYWDKGSDDQTGTLVLTQMDDSDYTALMAAIEAAQ